MFVDKYLDPKYVNIEKKMIFYDESYIWVFNRPRGAWIHKDSQNIPRPKIILYSQTYDCRFLYLLTEKALFLFLRTKKL